MKHISQCQVQANENKILKELLESKDEKINSLNEMIKKKDKKIEELEKQHVELVDSITPKDYNLVTLELFHV